MAAGHGAKVAIAEEYREEGARLGVVRVPARACHVEVALVHLREHHLPFHVQHRDVDPEDLLPHRLGGLGEQPVPVSVVEEEGDLRKALSARVPGLGEQPPRAFGIVAVARAERRTVPGDVPEQVGHDAPGRRVEPLQHRRDEQLLKSLQTTGEPYVRLAAVFSGD